MNEIAKALMGAGWVELPEAYGEQLWSSVVAKGAGHKYVKRVPYTKKNGKKGYRYYYKVQHGGGVHHEDHFVEGAAFQHEGGHYHVTSTDGDTVTVRHDETGKVHKISRKALKKLLTSHHKEAISAHHDKLRQEHADAMKYGTQKQKDAAAQRLKDAGISHEKYPAAEQFLRDYRAKMAKLKDKVLPKKEEPKKEAPKKEEPKPAAPAPAAKVHGRNDIHMGMAIGSSFRVVGVTASSVTISTNSGRGKRLTFRWDGKGYKRQGQYLARTSGNKGWVDKKEVDKKEEAGAPVDTSDVHEVVAALQTQHKKDKSATQRGKQKAEQLSQHHRDKAKAAKDPKRKKAHEALAESFKHGAEMMRHIIRGDTKRATRSAHETDHFRNVAIAHDKGNPVGDLVKRRADRLAKEDKADQAEEQAAAVADLRGTVTLHKRKEGEHRAKWTEQKEAAKKLTGHAKNEAKATARHHQAMAAHHQLMSAANNPDHPPDLRDKYATNAALKKKHADKAMKEADTHGKLAVIGGDPDNPESPGLQIARFSVTRPLSPKPAAASADGYSAPKSDRPVSPRTDGRAEPPKIAQVHNATKDNPVEIDDYPYGRQRTKARMWIETKGNQSRRVSQTMNPRTGTWNKPKRSTYTQTGPSKVVTGDDGYHYFVSDAGRGNVDLISMGSQNDRKWSLTHSDDKYRPRGRGEGDDPGHHEYHHALHGKTLNERRAAAATPEAQARRKQAIESYVSAAQEKKAKEAAKRAKHAGAGNRKAMENAIMAATHRDYKKGRGADRMLYKPALVARVTGKPSDYGGTYLRELSDEHIDKLHHEMYHERSGGRWSGGSRSEEKPFVPRLGKSLGGWADDTLAKGGSGMYNIEANGLMERAAKMAVKMAARARRDPAMYSDTMAKVGRLMTGGKWHEAMALMESVMGNTGPVRTSGMAKKSSLSDWSEDILEKAKYTKRWKGRDGKWRYEYAKPGGGKGKKGSRKGSGVDPAAVDKLMGNKVLADHAADKLADMYASANNSELKGHIAEALKEIRKITGPTSTERSRNLYDAKKFRSALEKVKHVAAGGTTKPSKQKFVTTAPKLEPSELARMENMSLAELVDHLRGAKKSSLSDWADNALMKAEHFAAQVVQACARDCVRKVIRMGIKPDVPMIADKVIIKCLDDDCGAELKAVMQDGGRAAIEAMARAAISEVMTEGRETQPAVDTSRSVMMANGMPAFLLMN